MGKFVLEYERVVVECEKYFKEEFLLNDSMICLFGLIYFFKLNRLLYDIFFNIKKK